MKKITSTLCMIFCISYTLFCQSPQLMFYGYVEQGRLEQPDSGRKAKGSEKLRDVRLFVYAEDSLVSMTSSRETGFYATLLQQGHIYKLVFEKEGYFCKCFEIDCREIVYGEDAALKCLTDVSLFPKIEDSDLLNLCKIPYAKASFNKEAGDIEWDMKYTEKIKQKFIALAQPYYTASTK